tara:strand:- start:418 stop:843 length:426 start_codon:yes stop_codon:yes gene_type:complete
MVLCVSGCSGTTEDKWTKDRPETFPVTGTVTSDGQPLQEATVVFRSTGAEPRTAIGRTDARGNFVLRTFEDGDGAVRGQQKVSITKTETEKIPAGINLDEVDFQPKVTSLIPKKYGSPETSGLTAEVTADGPNEFTFKLGK